jgi:hypothetical protein
VGEVKRGHYDNNCKELQADTPAHEALTAPGIPAAHHIPQSEQQNDGDRRKCDRHRIPQDHFHSQGSVAKVGKREKGYRAMLQAASGLPRADVLSGIPANLSFYAGAILLHCEASGDTNTTFGRYLVQTDVCEGRFVMTRITILAAAAAAVIVLGIAALSAEPRWHSHAATGLQPIAAQAYSTQ